MRNEINRETIFTIIKTKKNEVKKIQVDIKGVEIECDLDYPFCLKEFEDDTKKTKRYLPVDKAMIGNNPITPEDKEKLKRQFENEEIKEFKLKNIQVVQTFRIMDNSINFVTNYFRTNSELKETKYIEDETEQNENSIQLTQKPESNSIINDKNISINENLRQQVITYKNLLIHRDEHFCKKKSIQVKKYYHKKNLKILKN